MEEENSVGNDANGVDENDASFYSAPSPPYDIWYNEIEEIPDFRYLSPSFRQTRPFPRLEADAGEASSSRQKPSSEQIPVTNMKLKIVLKVPTVHARQRSKALKVVAGFPGVVSASIGGANKDQVVVVGEGVDPISLTKSLRKKMGSATVVAVGPVEEKKKEEKKEEKTTPPTEAESVDDFRSPSSSIFMEQEEERIQSSNNTSAEEERNPCTSDPAPLHQSEAENDDGLNHSRNPPVQTTTSSLSPFFADDTASGDRADIMEFNTGVVVPSADDLDLLFSVFQEIQLPNMQEELTEEQPSSSNSTLLIDSLFQELKTIVLQVDFRGALNKDVESKILHFCEILHRSALTQAQSNLLDRILAFQGLKSKLSDAIIIQESRE